MSATHNQPVLLLKTAVSHLTDYISNHNMAPQDALLKVSEELDLAPNFIKRASEAINVALTHSHFKKHADARDAEFPITDADAVTKKIFGDAVKQAADEPIDTDSFVPDSVVHTMKMASPRYQAAYSKIMSAGIDKQAMSEKGVYEKSSQYLDKLEKIAEEALNDKVNAEMTLKTKFASLVNDFSKDASSRQEWHDFESQAYAEYGEKAASYIDLVYKAAGFNDEPRGARNSNYSSYTLGKQTEKLGEVLTCADELKKTAADCDEADHNLKFELNTKRGIFNDYGIKTAQALYDRGDLTIIEEIALEKKAEEVKTPVVEDIDPVKTAASRWTKVAADDMLLSKLMKSVDFGKDTGGYLKNHSDNSKRQMIFTELASTDPILSKHEPQRLADAYLQMINLAPELSMQKEVARGQLRQQMANQAMNPHDADILVGTNTDLLKQDALRKGPPPVQSKPEEQRRK